MSRTTWIRLLSTSALAAALVVPAVVGAWSQPADAPQRPAAAAGAGPGAGGPFGYAFDRFDKDRNGDLTKAEWDAARDEIFAKADENGNGELTRREVRGFMEDSREEMRRAMRDPVVRLDRDRNGELTREEFLAGPEAMFKRLDSNGDGKLDRAEIEAARGQMRAMHGRMHGGGYGMMRGDDERGGRWGRGEGEGQRYGSGWGRGGDEEGRRGQRGMMQDEGGERGEGRGWRQGRQEGREGWGGRRMMMRAVWNRIDENGDSRIAKAEFAKASDWLFERVDANKDGKVTTDEVRDAMYNLRQMRRGANR